MRIVLDYLREYPVQWCAARAAGIHRKTLARWIKRSEAGDDCYDIEWQDVTCRFHEHCEAAIEEAKEAVEAVAWKLAMGVPYKSDPDLLNVGCGPKVYLRRPNGKMIRVLLERELPEEYGKNRKIDKPKTGGVLVIGSPAEKPKHYNTAASVKARQWKALARKVREAKR
jgi:hypothetical protein